MESPTTSGWRVVAITPGEVPDATLAAAAAWAGALGVLDLGIGDRRAMDQLAKVLDTAQGKALGVRVAADCRASISEVFDVVGTNGISAVVLGPGSPWQVPEVAEHWAVLAEVTSSAQGRAAQALGASGLITRGAESGGHVSDLGSFVLLQQVLGDELLTLPVWACGGIGPATAAAAVVGGAAGVVLDSQLALLPESALPDSVQARIALSNGTGTMLADGYHSLDMPQPGDVPVPIGADCAMALVFAERYGSAARAIKAVEEAVDGVARSPERFGEVAVQPGSAFARAMGTALPVVQGPMTRVSDQAGFARAVAEAGALPFLALALSTAEQTRDLLTLTKTELGDLPWGVGVLGFAPDQVRASQLQVIREFRPAAALIAGGRPDQTAELENAGIATFLHAPSPALLRQFLDAGARRFVFEGSECGGHVGPRSSFCLWQAAIDVLLDFVAGGGDPGELNVLFAGGIHDARSAAMVSTAAAPLTACGVAVGVLMGTAYLFTEEAVAHGAVQPLFQEQVVAAEQTVLLETAPGHVTRCLPSPFTDEFHAIRRDLAEHGVAGREAWQQLEDLNVGRLRIASKGIRREGHLLVSVDESEQYDEGMFMAGQVAVLRSAATDIAALHTEVTDGAVEFLAARAVPAVVTEDEPPAPLDVAIVGMSGMFPGAADLPAFWANVLANVDAVTEVAPDRWDPDVYHTEDTTPSTGDRTYSKWGGFLPRIPFDALRYGIPPTALASIEPVQLLALEAARRALDDAGYENRPFNRERTSVIFGTEAGSDLARAKTLRMMLRAYLTELPAALDEQLPRLTEDSFPGKLANVIAGRIANRLDLGGANYIVDAACGSSLAAVDLACKELLAGDSDVVLCGAADLHNSIEDFLMFSSVGALSPTGRCRPFDADGDGIALGEGVACVVLKRLADAERDGDRVYGVIKGIGSSSDGRAMGLTAPRTEGQRRALDRAYRNAGLSPSQIGLLEAHGTGTALGDRTELTTLDEAFTDGGATPGSCQLGSVKSQIGHTKCAAGLAGLIKMAMAVHTGVLPPTRISTPHPAWDAAKSPFVFRTRPVPWLTAAVNRVAAISAFGFGGTNFHLVLSGHGSAELVRHAQVDWPQELFLVRARDHAGAVRQLQRLRTLLLANDSAGRPRALRDFAKTVSVWNSVEDAPVRLAFVAGGLDELARLVGAVTSGETPDGVLVCQDVPDGKVAVLFPGQGSQRPGMLAELFVAFPELRRVARMGGPEVDAMFPRAAFGLDETRAQQDRLRDTQLAQPALGIAGLAVHDLLTRLGVHADMFAGHSYGELVALTAAGALEPTVLLEISRARARSIVDAAGDDPGAMAAVSAPRAAVERVLAELPGARPVIANHNAPEQTVISGPSAAVDAAMSALAEASLSATALPVACAFHSPVVAAAGPVFGAVLAHTGIREPDRPVWANRTAARYERSASAVRAELAAQIGSPVLFTEQIEAMYADGARVFVEAGPGSVLGGLVGKILGDRPHTVVTPGENGLRGLLTALARLAAAGIDVRPGPLHSGRHAMDLTFAEPPARPRWTVDGHLVRTKDGDVVPGGLTPARRITTITDSRTTAVTTPSGREALVSEFLRASRELVAAQRDVMLGYLGSSGAGAVASTPVVELPAVRALAPAAAPPRPAEQAEAVAETDLLTAVVAVISKRTGYPPDMIDSDLDLEADLSVDSIKRTEIAGELAGRTENGRSFVEELIRSRTAADMAKVLGGGKSAVAVASSEAEPEAAIAVGGAPAGVEPSRFVLELVEAEIAADPVALVGATIVIAGGERNVAEALADRLSASGALPVMADSVEQLDAVPDIDGLVSLHGLTVATEPVLPEIFPLFRAALSRVQWCVAVAAAGAQTWGLRGFFRSLEREYPLTLTRVIELDQVTDVDQIAETVISELQDGNDAPVVLAGEQRLVPRLVPARLGGLALTGAGPAGDGAAELAAAGLTADSVVLLVGGARGITAKVAVAIATATRCRIELVGRTARSAEAEPAEVAAAADLPALRGALAALGHREPAENDRRAREVLARREVEATLSELRGLGSLATYHAADVTDPDAVRGLVKQVHAERGRLDGVIFAAGVIEDRLIADKEPTSFSRVFRTKVDGARGLLGALDDLPEQPGIVVFFGSIAAVRGNRGQSDYAAANDALEAVGTEWSGRSGSRAVTVHWGPWAPRGVHGGMVTEELARSYDERGIGLLDPDAAVAALIRELAWGDAPAVLYAAPGLVGR
ncbi:SDR family NAD(P)-dependent oxidoreductase [Lentzea sp. JNUCC 0626]|uniref:SDR family NAD(P)-dependent oxidoreductase n=1 Tax=Lentzea sp. JNUCC 0626 TaxID=3367513 RepID=UPI003747CF45